MDLPKQGLKQLLHHTSVKCPLRREKVVLEDETGLNGFIWLSSIHWMSYTPSLMKI